MPSLFRFLFSGLALAATLSAATAASRPNIIVILADDIGYSDLGCYGGEIATPNLDRLAAGGLRFTQFYNTARCCPTRASLLTGLYPHQAGVGYMTDSAPYSAKAWINDWYSGDLRADTATLGEVLRGAGYGTYAVGKWHVTKEQDGKLKHNWPLQRGFDRYYGIIPGASNYFDPEGLVRDNDPITVATDAAYPAKDYYFTDAITDHAVRFLGDHTRTRAAQPFFMYIAYTAAHWPLQARPEDIARYHGAYDQGYGPIRNARFEKMRRLGLLKPEWGLSAQFGDWDKVERKEWEARCMEVYAAQIDRMDQGVGKIVAALKAAGQLENTLVFYLQDNGACAEAQGRATAQAGKAKAKAKANHSRLGAPALPGDAETWISYGEAWANVSNTPYRYYKHFVHEGGIATPLIAHWPAGIARHGELETQPGHLIDIMATCVDVAQARYPTERAGAAVQPMEGRSLVPAFGGRPIQREAIFWEHEGNRAIRVADWKLVAKGADGPWELYDLAKDRTELHDIAGLQSGRVTEMVALWNRWAERTHAVPWPWQPPYGAGRATDAKPAK